MELALRATYRPPSQTKTASLHEHSARVSGGKPGRHPRAAQPDVLCACDLPGLRTVVIGRSDGSVAWWRPKRESSTELALSSLSAHAGPVQALVFASDLGGSHGMLFTASADRTVKMWDLWSEEPHVCVQSLEHHGGGVNGLEYARRMVLSCGNDGLVCVWKPAAGRGLLLRPWMECVQTIRVCDSWVTCMCVRSSETLQLLAGTSDGDLVLYSMEHSGTASPVPADAAARGSARSHQGAAAPAPAGGAGFVELRRAPHMHDLGITALLALPSQRIAVSVGFDGAIRFVDVPTMREVFGARNARRARYTSLAWDSHHQEIVAGDLQGTVELWGLHAKRVLGSASVSAQGAGAVAAVSVGDSGRSLLCCSGGAAHRWRVTRGSGVAMTPAHSEPVIALFVRGGNAWGGGGGAAAPASTPTHGAAAPGHGGALDRLAASVLRRRGGPAVGGPEQAGGISEPAEELDAAQPQPAAASAAAAARAGAADAEDSADSAALHGERAILLSASVDNTVRGWDPTDMSGLFSVDERLSEMSAVLPAREPDSNLIILGCDDGSVRWCSVHSGSTVSFRHHANTVSCLCHAQRGGLQFLLSGSYDGCVGVWDVTRRRTLAPRLEAMVHPHLAPSPEVLSLAFLPALDQAPAPAAAGAAAAAAAATFARASLRAARGGLRPAHFASGSRDGVIRLWDLTSLTLSSSLAAHTEGVPALLCDTSLLYSGGEDGRVCIWNVHDPKEAHGVCSFRAHEGTVRALALLTSSGQLASCCATDASVKVWGIESGRDSDRAVECTKELTLKGGPTSLCEWQRHAGDAHADLFVGLETGHVVRLPVEAPPPVSSTPRGEAPDVAPPAAEGGSALALDPELLAELEAEGIDVERLAE